jgi:3-hydroxy-9,10-secoandrosta-1,3,5(10)-triene-9,17-dione monooxygenase
MSVTTQAREISGHPNLAPEKLGHKDLVARAAALIPQLRERVAEAEQTRKLPALNVEAVRNAGLFRVLQAARYGGHQQSLRTHIDTIALVAEGCSSTAWCMGVIHAHSWLMAHFPQAAQEETYGADPDAIISAIISPRGQAKPGKGGYMLNGVWPFGSGSQYAQWLFLGAAILNERGEVVDEADLLVPSRDVTIKDDWNVTGLRGTGSCTIVAQDVFVPEHRYLSLRALIAGKTPGAALHDGGYRNRREVPPTLRARRVLTGFRAAAAGSSSDPRTEVAHTEREKQMTCRHPYAGTRRRPTSAREALLSLRPRNRGRCRAR